MSYMPGGSARALVDLLESSAEAEELEIKSDEFVAKLGKAYKIALSIAAFLSLAVGIPSTFVWHEEVGIIFLVVGTAAMLVLPTLLSYRCVVNKISLKEEYFVLFVKCKKEVLWESVKYRRLKTGKDKSLKLYDANKRKLISFDGMTVGFDRIAKMAKRSSVKEYRGK